MQSFELDFWSCWDLSLTAVFWIDFLVACFKTVVLSRRILVSSHCMYGLYHLLLGGDFRPTFRNTCGNLCSAIKQVRKCPLFRLILSFYPLDMAFEVCLFCPLCIAIRCSRVTIGYFDSIKNLFGSLNFLELFPTVQ